MLAMWLVLSLLLTLAVLLLMLVWSRLVPVLCCCVVGAYGGVNVVDVDVVVAAVWCWCVRGRRLGEKFVLRACFWK